MKFIPTAILAVMLFGLSLLTAFLLPLMRDEIFRKAFRPSADNDNFYFWWIEILAIIGVVSGAAMFINAIIMGRRR